MRKLFPLLTIAAAMVCSVGCNEIDEKKIDAGAKLRVKITCKQFTDKATSAWKAADMGVPTPSEVELSKAYELVVMAMAHQAVSEGLNVDDLSREDLFQLAHRALYRVRPQLDKLFNGWVPSDKKAPESWYSL